MQNELDLKQVCTTLNEIMEYELAGVVRYTHSALMVVGPHRIPIVSFLQEQANESLQHAQQAGELLTGLDGHPSQKIAKIVETNNHSIKDILEESLEHELHALSLYKKPSIELHISNIYKREEFRHKSLISDVVTGIICGLGTSGYILAINSIYEMIQNGNK